jgi:DNA-binding transcriptional regulator YdaS (Cro superfamily)
MEKLLEYFSEERGRMSNLAKALSITPAAINQWKIIPADKLLKIETLTGIDRQQLRPDLYAGMKKPRRPSSQVSA